MSIYDNEDRRFYVYQLRREDSELPFYIGKGNGLRKDDHFKEHSLKRVSYKNGILKKCINENITVHSEILIDNLTDSESLLLEIELIKKYGRLDNKTGILANHTDGGDGCRGVILTDKQKDTRKKNVKRGKDHPSFGKTLSDETKRKISESVKKLPPPSLETRKKISESSTGRRWSEEQKKKSSLKKIGKKFTLEHRENISKGKKGIPLSDKQREGLKAYRETFKGKSNWRNRNGAKDVWILSSEIYKLSFEDNSIPKIMNMLGIEKSRSQVVGRVVKKCKEGWNPILDNDWITWSTEYLTDIK